MNSRKQLVFGLISLSIVSCAVGARKNKTISSHSQYQELRNRISSLEDENSFLKSKLQNKKSSDNRSEKYSEILTRVSSAQKFDRHSEVLTLTRDLSGLAPVERDTLLYLRAVSLIRLGLRTPALESFSALVNSKDSNVSRNSKEQIENSQFLKGKVSRSGQGVTK